MIALTDVRVFTVRCFYCNGGEFDHDRVTGACHVYARTVRPTDATCAGGGGRLAGASMKVCPKCQSKTIRLAQGHVASMTDWGNGEWGAHHFDVYICRLCGYTEMYAQKVTREASA